MPLAAGPGAHSQPRWSPDGRRLAYISTAEGGAAQLFVRWMGSGESVRITGLPDTPSSVAWSPDGRQIAYTLFVPGDGLKLGALPPKPEGAQWAPPLEIHTDVTYRTDEEGYLKPGFSHIFLVAADGGAPRQLSFGSVHDNGPLSWTPDGRSLAVQHQPLAQLGARGLQHRSLCARRGERDDRGADQPQRPGQRAGRLARRPADRLYRLRRQASAATRTTGST